MSWMKVLYETYDQNEKEIANFTRENYLCPIAHMIASSQIEIKVDEQGNFHGARQVTDRRDAEILIPVTDESAGRASGIAPHPLCDNLTYVAGDYAEYVTTKKEAESSKERFEEYIKALEKWTQSPHTCKKNEGIYRYVAKKTMIKDLVNSGIIALDETGKLSKEKIAKKSYDKCIVRFMVLGSELPEECWFDKSLFKTFQTYYLEYKKEYDRSDICYLTGKQEVISDNHPKGILPASYGAKLVSANDNTDFTFRGRFRNGEEAYAVSYEATQKAHNALKWLAKIQGYVVGAQDKRTYICWNIKKVEVPLPDALFNYPLDDEDNPPLTMPEYKQKLIELINGYRDQFEDTDVIALTALEAATTGRLSVVYYNQMTANDYFDRIREWYEHCCWQFTTYDQAGNPRQEVKYPFIKSIVEYAFGVQQDKSVKVSDKLLIMQYQRLFHCIVEKQRIPRDFLEAIFHRASRLESYSFGNKERLLSIACAVITKYYYDYSGEEIEMEVDKTMTDRSYLYGRLLAVYERVERSTYGKDEKREPNAIRRQAVYTQHPASTRLIIENALIPYFQRLSPASREFYRKEIEEISDKLPMDMENKQLDYKYLIGYWAERADLRKKNDDSKINDDPKAEEEKKK